MYSPGFQTHVEPGRSRRAAGRAAATGPFRRRHHRRHEAARRRRDPTSPCSDRRTSNSSPSSAGMVADLDLGIEIDGVPILRESDGLAMSSRNVRLTPDDRAAAVVLSQALRDRRTGSSQRRSISGIDSRAPSSPRSRPNRERRSSTSRWSTSTRCDRSTGSTQSSSCCSLRGSATCA